MENKDVIMENVDQSLVRGLPPSCRAFLTDAANRALVSEAKSFRNSPKMSRINNILANPISSRAQKKSKLKY
jgi:hypothetical protein